jgi:hypothetical protein
MGYGVDQRVSPSASCLITSTVVALNRSTREIRAGGKVHRDAKPARHGNQTAVRQRGYYITSFAGGWLGSFDPARLLNPVRKWSRRPLVEQPYPGLKQWAEIIDSFLDDRVRRAFMRPHGRSHTRRRAAGSRPWRTGDARLHGGRRPPCAAGTARRA